LITGNPVTAYKIDHWFSHLKTDVQISIVRLLADEIKGAIRKFLVAAICGNACENINISSINSIYFLKLI